MFSKMTKVFSLVLGLVGLIVIMGTAGADDFRVMQGMDGLPFGQLIGQCAIGISCILAAGFLWRVADAYE